MDKCSDCGGALEKGVMLDTTYGTTLIQRYAQSDNIPAEPKIIVGMNEANFNNLRRVLAYRCTKCNKIHTYAQGTVLMGSLNARTNKVWIIVLAIVIIAILVGVLSATVFYPS